MTTWIMRGGRCECNVDAVAEQKSNNQMPAQPVAAQGSDPIGRILNERYQLGDPAGRGGVCLVYKAEDLATRQLVAIKLMRPEFAQNQQAVQRLMQEVETASQLIHNNLVRVHGYGQDRKGEPYLVMDFVAGKNLEELLTKSDGKLEPRRALDIFTQICEGLNCAHAHGVIHRDLKPSNIIISSEAGGRESVKIVDFGFAKLTEEGDASMRLTQTGEVFGSPFYMSPEHCLGKELDQRSDIYSLGCLMYETLTGSPPLQGDNVLATVAKQVTEEPTSMRTFHRSISESLDNVVLKCLAKEPVLRYQSVDDLLSDLNSVKSGKHVKALFKKAKQPSHAEHLKSLRIRQMPRLEGARLVGSLVITILIVAAIGIAWLPTHNAGTTAVTGPVPEPIKPIDSAPHLPSLEKENASSGSLTNHTPGAKAAVLPTKASPTSHPGLRPSKHGAPPVRHSEAAVHRIQATGPAKTTAPNSQGWSELKGLRIYK